MIKLKSTFLSILFLVTSLSLSSDQTFDHAVNFVLHKEGIYNNHPNDIGGETKFGISKRSYPNIAIASLTFDEAIAIYRRDFWDPCPYKKIKNPKLAVKLFDLSVNMGRSQAHKLLKLALQSLGYKVSIDGIIKNDIINLINSLQPNDILTALKLEATKYYLMLTIKNKKNSEFLRGWIKRTWRDWSPSHTTHFFCNDFLEKVLRTLKRALHYN